MLAIILVARLTVGHFGFFVDTSLTASDVIGIPAHGARVGLDLLAAISRLDGGGRHHDHHDHEDKVQRQEGKFR